jgi:hypothetical protein
MRAEPVTGYKHFHNVPIPMENTTHVGRRYHIHKSTSTDSTRYQWIQTARGPKNNSLCLRLNLIVFRNTSHELAPRKILRDWFSKIILRYINDLTRLPPPPPSREATFRLEREMRLINTLSTKLRYLRSTRPNWWTQPLGRCRVFIIISFNRVWDMNHNQSFKKINNILNLQYNSYPASWDKRRLL